MTTTSTQSDLSIQPGYEPIPGYRVDSLLGRGGFGEVWKCHAPGGLWKAIKFVYGAVDQDRATRELKSLNRVKGALHPFLLTLERFEFIAGRLVIVTELADGSLEDEFNQRRARGSCGIPRDQLLASLCDAADALDYLHQQHQLLHLDIKPGNLLVQGGHVKVADFGLMKDLKELECSIVAGLTPVYAPPELFDGRPSVHSDQYSLAVVFQELLTGVRPFTGRTIAQLATQHIHAAPNLSPLLPADRPVIARALEKNPDRRFASCREFIAALQQSSHRGSSLPSSVLLPGDRERFNDDTSVGQFPGFLGGPQIQVDELPALSFGSSMASPSGSPEVSLRHGLVIGLGGVGRECFDHLHQLIKLAGSTQPLAIHSLLIDTDFDTLHGADQVLQGDNPSTVQTLCVPLRTAREYQQIQDGRLSTISRRWVFNVPRNGQTVGMRPLGRLALVDHAQRVNRSLDSIVTHYQSFVEQTEPTVYVVGSLDGGTGSGMLFDIVHLLRHSLDKHGLEHAKVIPLLATSALMANSNATLASHNSACALTEMGHLIKIANGYPGDTGVGWPSVPAARSPLDSAYVIAAGDEASSTPMPSHTIAEYIWLDSALAGSILDAAREPGQERRLADLASATLRSVGVCRLAFCNSVTETLHAPLMAQRLIEQWCGHPLDQSADIQRLVAKYLPAGLFDLNAVMRSCLQQLDPAMGADNQCDYLQHWAMAQQRMMTDLANRQLTLHELRASLGELAVVAETSLNKVRDSSEPTQPQPDDSASPGDLLAYRKHRLWNTACESAAGVYTQWLAAIQAMQDRANERIGMVERLAESLSASLAAHSAPSWDQMDEGWQRRADTAVHQLWHQLAPNLLIAPLTSQSAEPSPAIPLADLLEEAAGLARALQLADADAIAAGGEVERLPPAAVPITPSLPVNPRSLLFTDEPDELSEEEAVIGLVAACEVGAPPPEVPSAPIQAIRRDDHDYQTLAATALEAVRPRLLECGGSQRLLLLVGSADERQLWDPVIREKHSGSLTTIVLPGVPATLVCEAQKIKLGDLKSRVVASLGGREDVLARLHSRCDIKWS